MNKQNVIDTIFAHGLMGIKLAEKHVCEWERPLWCFEAILEIDPENKPALEKRDYVLGHYAGTAEGEEVISEPPFGEAEGVY